MHLEGTMSTFGGPHDTTLSTKEGLALVDNDNFAAFSSFFLSAQPKGTTGLARRLDPTTNYIACRWDYSSPTRAQLRKGLSVRVTNPSSGVSLSARPVDWGPNEHTGRVADISPGLATGLGLQTGDNVVVDWP